MGARWCGGFYAGVRSCVLSEGPASSALFGGVVQLPGVGVKKRTRATSCAACTHCPCTHSELGCLDHRLHTGMQLDTELACTRTYGHYQCMGVCLLSLQKFSGATVRLGPPEGFFRGGLSCGLRVLCVPLEPAYWYIACIVNPNTCILSAHGHGSSEGRSRTPPWCSCVCQLVALKIA